MDMKYINENHVVERYLQGTLSQEECDAFEALFLASPELLDQLESAEQLQLGLQAVGADPFESVQARRAFPTVLFHSPRYAMAATVFLAVSLVVSGGLYMKNMDLAGSLPSGFTSAVDIVALETVRSAAGEEPFNVIDRGAMGSQVVLLVDPGFEPFDHFRATLNRLDGAEPGATVLQLDKLQPAYSEMLAISLPAALLESGDYEVRVEGWRSGSAASQDFEPANRVTFRVR